MTSSKKTTQAVAPPQHQSGNWGYFRNFAGGQNGRFFNILPPYVDPKQRPGFSVLPRPSFLDWIGQAAMLRHIWASPNLVWSTLALLVYFLTPYDLTHNSTAARAPLSLAFFAQRFPIWAVVTLGYTAFWHVTLYGLGWSQRPMVKGRPYSYMKVAHNVFYSLLGLAMWTCFENVFAFLWATGRLPYLTDTAAFSTLSGFVNFFLGLVAIPLWRDVHFYFAHRLLHYGPLFTHVHSLHHRNTDIEPFAGLCMHPIEHLFYYACIAPSLVFFCSPFHFLWNGTHLLLAPAASHSGFEDHMQADNFHFMHHRYFECNYAGFTAAALDVAFGTFTASFKEGDKADFRHDAKATLAGPPTPQFVFYLLASSACLVLWAAGALGYMTVTPTTATLLAAVAGFGPVLVACCMTLYSRGPSGLLAPFGKKPFFEHALHLALGFAFCSVPVYEACRLVLVQ